MAVKGTFTATGNSADDQGEVLARVADVHISGAFTATVEVQTKDSNGVWCSSSSATATITGTGSALTDHVVVDSAVARPVRVECTAYTSGTVTYAIEGALGKL